MDSNGDSDEDADKVDFDEVDPNEMDSDENSDEDADKVEADKVDFNKVDPDEMDSDKDPDEGKANEKVNRYKVNPNKVDSDKFDPKKMDIDAVVTLGASTFKSDISNDAVSLRSSRSRNFSMPLTHGPDVALHDRTISVLDALAYVSVNESSSAVAIGLTMGPLQLVVATNEEIAPKPILEHLTTICSTLKNLSDTNFNGFSVKNLQSVNLREMSLELDLEDENLQSLYNDLFLQLYKYSYDRLQTKHAKRWEVIEGFRSQYVGWQNTIALEQGTRCVQIESQETFLSLIERFWICSMGLRDCLDQFCRSGWKIDIDEMEVLKTKLARDISFCMESSRPSRGRKLCM